MKDKVGKALGRQRVKAVKGGRIDHRKRRQIMPEDNSSTVIKELPKAQKDEDG